MNRAIMRGEAAVPGAGWLSDALLERRWPAAPSAQHGARRKMTR